ncbi:MAG TPA: hypothetical protein PKA02_00375 [Candidatus Saccharibacteria bacterium]|nr:hypothetical protein [Candidatus Saccharibacteria bacterium]
MIYIAILVLLAIAGIGAWVLIVRKQTKDVVKADPTVPPVDTTALPTNLPADTPPVDQPVQPAPTQEAATPDSPPTTPPNQV